jgi:hypothetical protein
VNPTSTNDESTVNPTSTSTQDEDNANPTSAQDEGSAKPASTPGKGSLSPIELRLMYTALGCLSTSLKVLGDSQRAMNARFEANDAAYERHRALHQENLMLLRTVAELRLVTRDANAVGSAATTSRGGNAAKPRVASAVARTVSGKARRRRARSQSAAG